MSTEIGAFALGEAEGELDNLADAGGCPPRVARRLQAGWHRALERYGDTIIYQRRQEGALIPIPCKAAFRSLRAEELINGVKVSDQAVLIQIKPLLAVGIKWPPMDGDRIIRAPNTGRESLFAIIEPPQVASLADIEIVLRAVARGLPT